MRDRRKTLLSYSPFHIRQGTLSFFKSAKLGIRYAVAAAAVSAIDLPFRRIKRRYTGQRGASAIGPTIMGRGYRRSMFAAKVIVPNNPINPAMMKGNDWL